MALMASQAKATYTDYIGAGHDSGVTATACSTDQDSPTVGAFPENTINGSGLTGNSHSTEWIHTWTSLGMTPAPNPNPAHGSGYWLHYDLGSQYQLTLMHVWNANEVTGRGFNSVTIDHSSNGSTWTELGTFDWPQATGSPGYTGFDGPDFGGVSARYVLITANSHYGDGFGYALSEIKINISTGPPDTDPPTPNPPTWASPPTAAGPWSISMTANTGTDPSGVQYYFEETSGNEGGTSSNWQSNNSYTDQFLTPQTQYTYRIKMRDLSPQLNVTDWSDPCSATTDELPTIECPDGDLDDDCDCDGDDLLIFAAQWMDPPGCVSHPNDCADLNEQDGVDGADFAVFYANWQDAGAPIMLVINEMMASNSTTIADEHGQYDDWIEIFNPGPSAVLMSGMFLEDNDGFRWEIPPNIGINSGQYLVFWADDGWPAEGNLHTNFKLDKDGDGITLYDTDGITVLDTKSFSSMDTNISYGRYPDTGDNWYDMIDATPGFTNAMGMSCEVYFSRQAGIFTGSFSLALTAKSPAAIIRYTTNGSEPTESIGQLYTGPISITNTSIIRAAAFEPGYSRGPVKTKTYISLADVYSQPALPDGFPDLWHEGEPVNYQMYPDVVTEYAAYLDDAFTSIPSLSIVMDMNDLFSQEIGIYCNSLGRGVEWERPGSAELLFADGSEGFAINCGVRMYGGASCIPSENLKHTFRLLFKGIYGPTKLDFPLFDDESAVTQFDTIVLRGGNDYSWVHRQDIHTREGAEYIRDIFARDTQRAMGKLSSHGNYVHLYLNGLYWGLYNPSERPDTGFLSAYYGGEKEDWDAMNKGEVIDGDRTAWNTMMAIAEAGLSSQSAYEEIQECLDVESLITYIILNHYIGNTDWSTKNWYVGRLREPGAGYKFFSWDAEISMFDVWENNTGDDHPDSAQRLFQKLRDNAEFRVLFADHVHRHTFNGGVLTPNPCIERYSQRVDEIYTAIIGESARWGDNRMETHGGLPYTRDDDWIPSVNYILDDFMPYRTDILLDQYRAIDLYPTVATPVFYINGSYQHGGYVSAGASLTMTKTGGGTIYYTTDGSDPRLVGGAVSGSASTSLPFTLNDTKHIKARVKDGSNWSALNEAIFAVDPAVENLRITEIMYNVNDPNHEFIELKNIGGSALNLNLVKFTDGIGFTFPSLALPAGGYCVVVRNQASFTAKYPSVPGGKIAGEFTGAINNAGERIELVDALGTTILNFRFKDGWYPITDGDDFSLNIIDPSNPDPNSWEYAEYWQPSSVAGGTPGDIDTGHLASPGDIVINEVMTHTNSYPNDWIELHNTTGGSINIAGWFLSDDSDKLQKYEIQSTSIPAGGYVVFTQDDDFGNASDPGSNIQFAFSELGETVYLCSGSGDELAGGFCTKEDFKASEDGVSFGRYTKSAAAGYDVDFVSMTAATPDANNATTTPKVGPIVITEIMYHPPDPNSYAEYVEIRNISGTTVILDDWLLTDESGGIEYYIPSGTSLTTDTYLLLVKNQVAFENVFGSVGVTVLEWLEGRLNNAGEKIEIQKPGTPEPSGFVPYIRVDRVNYSDGYHGENFRELGYNDPWPTSPDTGVPRKSLRRVVDGNYGNDVANWQGAEPTPGY